MQMQLSMFAFNSFLERFCIMIDMILIILITMLIIILTIILIFIITVMIIKIASPQVCFRDFFQLQYLFPLLDHLRWHHQ